MNDKIRLKRDIILVLVMLAAAMTALLIINYGVKKKGTYAVVKVDGKELYKFELDKDTTVDVAGYQGGVNRIEVKAGKVSMTEADCPDELCVKTGKISRTGETIVCLPHRVVIEIKSTQWGNTIDSVVR